MNYCPELVGNHLNDEAPSSGSMAFDKSYASDNRILDSFECIDAYITDQDAYDNALASLQNSIIS